MKNTKNLIVIASLGFATLMMSACGSGTSSESNTEAKMAMDDSSQITRDCGPQDNINVSNDAINYADAKTMNDNFGLFFRDGRDMSKDLNFIDSIDNTAVINLIEGFNQDNICKGHYVRGLAIEYGMDKGKLVNIYRPLLYNKTDQSNADNHDYNVVYGEYYTWNNSQFVKIDNAADLISEYQTNMKIKRDGVTFTPYNEHNGDTEADNQRANLMTEKELQELYNANHGSGSKLYFFPIAKKVNVSGVDIYKHDHVVAAVNNLRVTGGHSGWNVAVDDAHLPCPHMCEVVQLQ